MPASAHAGFGELDGSVDGGGVAGDDDLIGRIETRGRDDFTLSGLSENGIELPGGELQEGSHRADAGWDRLLHVLASLAD